jgi:hypothetical protein
MDGDVRVNGCTNPEVPSPRDGQLQSGFGSARRSGDGDNGLEGEFILAQMDADHGQMGGFRFHAADQADEEQPTAALTSTVSGRGSAGQEMYR